MSIASPYGAPPAPPEALSASPPEAPVRAKPAPPPPPSAYEPERLPSAPLPVPARAPLPPAPGSPRWPPASKRPAIVIVSARTTSGRVPTARSVTLDATARLRTRRIASSGPPPSCADATSSTPGSSAMPVTVSAPVSTVTSAVIARSPVPIISAAAGT